MYSPAEDSYFLSKIIKQEIRISNDLEFLDLGCGSCIQAETALKSGIKKENILCVDIDKEAITQAKKIGFKAIKSNLFEKIKKKKFDIIAFNPPYLPDHKYDKKPDTSGGKKGDETILRFLKQAKKHLKNDGKIFLLFSSLTPINRINQEIRKQELKITKKFKKGLFFEKLYVYLIA